MRFVRRSSSSVDLASFSLDAVRAERAAIALSVGQCWPPDKRRRSARRPSGQQLCELALQEPSSTTVSSRMVSAHSGSAGGHQETPSPDRPTRGDRPRQHSGRPGRPSRCTRRRRAQRQRHEAPQNPCGPHRARPGRDGPVEDRAAMEHAAVLVRGPAPVPWRVRRDQQPRTAANAAHWKQRSSAKYILRVSDALCLSEGDDHEFGARVAQGRGTRRSSQPNLDLAALAWHALEPQEARQVRERAPQP